MDIEDYFQKFRTRVRTVDNFYDEYPWLWGALGNPNSKIVFVGLAPSLRQVIGFHNEAMMGKMEESQWYASKGDRIFRNCLVQSGFKKWYMGQHWRLELLHYEPH